MLLITPKIYPQSEENISIKFGLIDENAKE